MMDWQQRSPLMSKWNTDYKEYLVNCTVKWDEKHTKHKVKNVRIEQL